MRYLTLIFLASRFALGSPSVNGIADSYTFKPIQLTMSCEFGCQGEQKKQVSIEGVFDPEAGLHKGNNNLPGSYTEKIWLWSKLQCLNAALSQCRGRDKVESLSLSKIASGEWSLPSAPNCANEKKLLVLAPYDPSQIPKVKWGSIAPPETHLGFRLEWERPVAFSRGEIRSEKSKPRACNTVVHGKICGGDCMEGSRYQLVSPNPLLLYSVDVCADKFVAEYAKYYSTKDSPALIELECERFFIDSATGDPENGPATNGSCAATRAEVDCGAVVQALRNYLAPKTPEFQDEKAAPKPAPPPETCPNCPKHGP